MSGATIQQNCDFNKNGMTNLALLRFDESTMRRCKFIVDSKYNKYVALRLSKPGPIDKQHKNVENPRAYANALAKKKLRIERLREARENLRSKSKTERSEVLRSRVARAIAQGRSPGSKDWIALDQTGKPIVSFDPGSPRHDWLCEVLRRPPRDRERVSVIEKVGSEFRRIYERYRRDAERHLGRSYSDYVVEDKEQKYCEEAGMYCILKGVTPRQLLQYWDSNIRHFSGGMKIPPLAFLKSPANIDRVAIANIDATAKVEKGADKEKPVGGNTYSMVNGLDVRLRPGLNEAGFDTTPFNDRYMLSIQHNAMSIASGTSLFLAEGIMRKMVMWAVRNLYQ